MDQKNNGIKIPKKAEEILELYYLDARSYLLETAAIMDRIERAQGGEEILKSPMIGNLRKCCELISGEESKRAERMLNMLSIK